MKYYRIIFFIFSWSIVGYGQLYHQYTTLSGLPSNEIYKVFEDISNQIWLLTDQGISHFDGYQFTNYDVSNGLYDQTVFDMVQMSNGDLVMLTLSGKLFVKPMQADTIIPFFNNHIIASYWTGINSYLYIDNDTIHIPIRNQGLLSFAPDSTYSFVKSKNNEIKYLETNQNNLLYVKSGDRLEDVDTITFIDSSKAIYFNRLKSKYTTSSSYFDHVLVAPSRYLCLFENFLGCLDHGRLASIIPSENAIKISNINGKIYLHKSLDEGVFVYNSMDDLLKGKHRQILNGMTVSAIVQTNQGGVWVTTLKNGAYYVPSIEHFDLLSFTLQSTEKYEYIFASTNRHLLLFESMNGIYTFDTLSYQTQKLRDFDYLIYQIEKTGNTKYIIATDRGTIAYDEITNDIVEVKNNNEVPLLVPKTINSNFDGKTLSASGLSSFGIIDIDRLAYTYTAWSNNNASDIGKQRIISIYQSSDGTLWMGLVDGLYRLHDNKLQKQNIPILANSRIDNILEMQDSSLLLVIRGKGLFQLKKGVADVYTNDPQLSNSVITRLKLDSEDVWVGTDKGLFIIAKNGKVRRIHQHNGLMDNFVRDWYHDGKYLWVLCFNGISKVDLSKSYAPNLPRILSVNEVHDIHNNKLNFDNSNSDLSIKYIATSYHIKDKVMYRYRVNADKLWSYTDDTYANLQNLKYGDYLFEVQAQNEDGMWSPSDMVSFTIQKPWYLRNVFIAFALISCASLIYTIYRWRLRKIQMNFELSKHIKELEASALQAQMNPHFIFNCLNSIQKYVITNDKAKASYYLSSFALLMRKILDSSVQGYITLSDEIDFIRTYLELEKLRFKNKFEYQINVPAHQLLDTIKIRPLLVQPCVENAIIHAMSYIEKQGVITIDIESQEKFVTISIQDNGPGFTESPIDDKNSVGISNTTKRLTLESYLSDKHHTVSFGNIYNSDGSIVGAQVIFTIFKS